MPDSLVCRLGKISAAYIASPSDLFHAHADIMLSTLEIVIGTHVADLHVLVTVTAVKIDFILTALTFHKEVFSISWMLTFHTICYSDLLFNTEMTGGG